MQMQTICVVGAGTMGRGIAQVFAESGFEVIFYARRESGLREGFDAIEKILQSLVTKNRILDCDAKTVLSRIQPTTTLENAAQADLVVETIAEDLHAKQEIFQKLEEICSRNTVLTSNTSSISISGIAAAIKVPERVCGMHFFYPPSKMPVVEIPVARQTSPKTVSLIKGTVQRLSKTAIETQETPGFVFNRLMIPMINEAAYLLMEGVASREDIDAIMRLAASHKIGPLALGDVIGLDVCLNIMENLHRELGEDKYRPCPLLRRMVYANQLGRKTGKGFYEYV